MLDPIWIFIAAVFVLAGFVKGVIGLGLPTVSMGLLAIVMPPAQAAAILMAPSLVTNFWQAVTGGHLRPVMLRLWSMMLGVCIGTWAGAGLITGTDARYGAAILGLAWAIYAAAGHRVSVLTSMVSGTGPVEGAARTLRTRDLMASSLNWRAGSFEEPSGSTAAYMGR